MYLNLIGIGFGFQHLSSWRIVFPTSDVSLVSSIESQQRNACLPPHLKEKNGWKIWGNLLGESLTQIIFVLCSIENWEDEFGLSSFKQSCKPVTDYWSNTELSECEGWRFCDICCQMLVTVLSLA